MGVNHVALEVGDVEAALEWYGRIFEFTLRGRSPGMAFIDLGDQFVALAAGRRQPPDDHRHFGLVVDDKDAARRRLEEAGAEIVPVRGLRFVDPWGNNVEVVQYDEIQFSKKEAVLRAMRLGDLGKTQAAREELRRKGIDDQIVKDVLDEVQPEDEEAAARTLVRRKLRSLQRVDRATATRRLTGMLARKGHSGDVVWRVVREELDAGGFDEKGDEVGPGGGDWSP